MLTVSLYKVENYLLITEVYVYNLKIIKGLYGKTLNHKRVI